MRQFSVLLSRFAAAVSVSAFFAVYATDGETSAAARPDTARTAVVKHLKSQTVCPVQGGEINKNMYVDYKGKRIYVCCEACIADVKKDPEKYIKKLADMGQEVETISAKQPRKVAKSRTAKSDTTMKGMDMGKDSSMKDMK
jgi:YHS domain-containing protein